MVILAMQDLKNYQSYVAWFGFPETYFNRKVRLKYEDLIKLITFATPFNVL